MKPIAYGQTDPGRVRKNNEDSFLIAPELGLYALCDGVGGHNAGEVASKLCVETLRQELGTSLENLKRGSIAELAKLLQDSIQIANQKIFKQAQADVAKQGMGTTLVAVLVAKDQLIIGHVGDSSVYLVRGKQAHKLTEDHNVATELKKEGTWKPEDIERSPYAHHLTRTVGGQEFVQVDILPFEPANGDLLVLCSDGLSDYLEGHQLADFLSSGDLSTAPNRLIDFANSKGGQDNITNIVIRVDGVKTESLGIDSLKKSDILGKVALFGYLDYPELLKVLNLMEVKSFDDRKELIREGTPGDELFVIVSGQVEITKGGQSLAKRGKGDLFGEMCLFDSAPRSASVIALGQVSAMTANRQNLMTLLRRESQICVKLLWAINQELNSHLRATTQELVLLKATQAGSRSPDSDDTKVDLPFNSKE